MYPFEQRAVRCSVCYAVMHVQCYNLQRSCAKCVLQGRLGEATIIGAMGDMSTPVIGPTTTQARQSSQSPPQKRQQARQHNTSEDLSKPQEDTQRSANTEKSTDKIARIEPSKNPFDDDYVD